MFRSISLVLASACVTALLILGFAKLPGGERISQSLNSAAENWFSVPLETQMISALSELKHPEQRGLMVQLVMQHIAKDARLARHNEISTRPPAGWQVPLPSLVMKSDQALQALKENNLVTIKPSQPLFENSEAKHFNGWAALACFLVAVLWVSLRRG
ncbi:MAG: hypothetical protein AB8C46_17890 [Burkholderiaceae bacterium]